MSIALQLLVGGALFLAALWAFGSTGIVVLGAVLVGLELLHDLHRYRRRGHG